MRMRMHIHVLTAGMVWSGMVWYGLAWLGMVRIVCPPVGEVGPSHGPPIGAAAAKRQAGPGCGAMVLTGALDREAFACGCAREWVCARVFERL
jgi:hypothetical protein